MNEQKGFYWHVHHSKLAEWCYNYDERVDAIRKNKPKNEIKTRLRLLKPVKDVKAIPKEYREADKKWREAEKKLEEAEKKWEKAWKKLEEAEKKWEEAWKKYAPQLEKLHKKECGCKEWNGKEIVFK